MNNSKFVKYGKRIIFTVFTQGLLSIIAILIGFGLPKFLNIEEYARWQLYYFYVAYVNYLQFGFNDGMILTLSGNTFEKLPWKSIRKSTFYIMIYLLGLSIVTLSVGSLLNVENYKILEWLVLSFVPTIVMCILSAVFLAGNRTYEYNVFCLLIKVAFIIMMLIGILLNQNNADFYICADILSKIIIIAIYIILERKVIFSKSVEEVHIGKFIKENCKTGVIVATTVLILGLLPMCGKIIIQIWGTASQYAWFSFAISMLSIILTFTTAIGTVTFPVLKNLGASSANSNRILLRMYDEILGVCLICLGIIEIIVEWFLPQYISVLEYFPLLLAACWPLGKIQTIIYPYFKLYRKEIEFLKISICYIIGIFLFSFWGYRIGGLIGLSWVAFLGIEFCYEYLKKYLDDNILAQEFRIDIIYVSRVFIFILIAMIFKENKFICVYVTSVLIYYLFFGKKIYTELWRK